jgi:hypothetical protein
MGNVGIPVYCAVVTAPVNTGGGGAFAKFVMAVRYVSTVKRGVCVCYVMADLYVNTERSGANVPLVTVVKFVNTATSARAVDFAARGAPTAVLNTGARASIARRED